ncbi:MAG: UvrD-helicase domain-containing protein [Candidatus Cloacimonetes bacterium]|nr:UvrD-helicase domain-containing protein [Candidatus Cloacimonadota bacterium]
MNNKSPLKRSLDLSKNRIVSACAGAGKTYALSKRYCKILDEFTAQNLQKPKSEWLGYKNILVITFTKKAAAEMSRRIYEDLHKLLQGNTIQELEDQGISIGEHIQTAPEEYKRWLRSTFSQNYIMTIDSFCGTILRENAFLLGIDPQFKTSDELLANKMYQETLSEFLTTKSRAFNEKLKNILKYTDKNGLERFFNYFEHNKVFLEEWIHYIQIHTEQDIYDRWLEKYLHEFDADSALSELRKIATLSQTVKLNEENTLQKLHDLINSVPQDSILEKRRFIMIEILPILMTAKRESYYSDRSCHFIQKKSAFINDTAYKAFKQITSKVISVLEQEIPAEKVLLAPSSEDKKSITVLKDFVKLYTEFEERLWNTQLQKNYLTFNEVIIKTRKLLNEHEDVRRRIAGKFKHILVDEFQDTNNLRWDIIRHIAQTENGIIRDKGLFIVGDKKQSIYRFQQADVEVMNRAQDELSNLSDDTLIEFNDNYRASKNYIRHVINPIFTDVFSSPEHPFEANFEETTYPDHNSSETEISDKTQILCDIHATSYEPNEPEYVPALHAAFMAKKYLKWADEVGLEEDVVVGILLRNFIHIHEYLRIFQKYDLPFQIIGERNLFSQQEIYDLFHFISVMINPHDDVALVGLLRSPFFCVEDTLIYELKDREKEISIFDFMEEDETFAFIHNTIVEWRQSARSIPLDNLLQNILSQDHREFGYISEIGGPQRLANIDKIIHVLHSLQMDGNSLQGIHEYLSYQLDHKSDVAQGDLPTSAKVQIMTIHKAKGLEFPAVIIPELDSTSTKKNAGIIYHSRLLPGEQIEVGVTLKESVESIKTNLLENIKRQDKVEQEAEDKRLFYVAVTRAKYRVALLADFKGNPKKSSWWNEYVSKTFTLPKTSMQEEWDSVETPEKICISYESIEEMKGALQKDEDTQSKKMIWKELLANKELQKMWQVTPHVIMESVFPEIIFESSREENSAGECHRAFGSIFHAIIANHWWNLTTHKENICIYMERVYPEISFEDIEQKLQTHLSNFISSDLYQIVNSLPSQELFHELPVRGWLENGEIYLEVNGILDLLYKNGDKWYIFDFKTDKTLRAHHIYEIQLQTYQWMVKQLYNIDAQAFIYYSSINELREVKWEDEYYVKIFPEEQHPFVLSGLEDISILENILSKLNLHDRILILNPTNYQSKRMTQALAKRKLLTPNIQITTLNNLLVMLSAQEKRITPECGTLLVKKAAEGVPLKEGTVELLSDAFRKCTLWKQKFRASDEFEKIHSNYEQLRQEKHYKYDFEIPNKGLKNFFDGKTVILNGFYKESPLEFEAVSQISKHTEKLYFINNFDAFKMHSSFDITPNIWNTVIQKNSESESRYTQQYSIETEIDSIAGQIHRLMKDGRNISKIKMAVSSMDAYLPVIRKIFPSYGIPYHSLAGNRLIDKPLTNFMTSLLTIMLSSERLTWNTVSSLVLHPLFDTERDIFELDVHLRKNGIHYFSDITEIKDIKNYSEAIHHITDLISNIKDIATNLSGTSLLERIDNLFNETGINTRIEQNESLHESYLHIQKCIKNTLDIYHDIGLQLKPDNILKDIKKALKTQEIPSRKGHKGVEILGFMDTLELNDVILFIVGLSENYFPVPQKNNPFASSIPAYNWEKSVMLLNHWQKLDSELYYSCAERDMDGNVLNPSTLLETFTQTNEINDQATEPVTARQHYLSYYDHIIENPILPVLKRHNEYQIDAMGSYKGLVKTDGKSTFAFSASDMNTLIQCPMQYLFKDVLNLKPLSYDEDAEQRLQVGNVIHKALEHFGKNNGFPILKESTAQALDLIAESLFYALNKFHVDTDRDLFIRRVYSPYADGLSSGKEDNLLVQLLTFDSDYLKEYSPINFEQVFGMLESGKDDTWTVYQLKNEKVTLHFRGKIDGIFQKNDQLEILGIDYKTGFNPTPAEIESFWDIQPFLYILVMKSHFPESKIAFLYESLKDIAKSKDKQLTLYEENELFIITHKKTTLSQSKEATKNLLLHYGTKVTKGEFHIREREYGSKPCSYCDFKRLCRKDCFPFKLKDIHQILESAQNG